MALDLHSDRLSRYTSRPPTIGGHHILAGRSPAPLLGCGRSAAAAGRTDHDAVAPLAAAASLPISVVQPERPRAVDGAERRAPARRRDRRAPRAARASARRSSSPTLTTESVPRPTRRPAASKRRSGASPCPCARLESGQCATGASRSRQATDVRPLSLDHVNAERPRGQHAMLVEPLDRRAAERRGHRDSGARARRRRRALRPGEQPTLRGRLRQVHRQRQVLAPCPAAAAAIERPAHGVRGVRRDAQTHPADRRTAPAAPPAR